MASGGLCLEFKWCRTNCWKRVLLRNMEWIWGLQLWGSTHEHQIGLVLERRWTNTCIFSISHFHSHGLMVKLKRKERCFITSAVNYSLSQSNSTKDSWWFSVFLSHVNYTRTHHCWWRSRGEKDSLFYRERHHEGQRYSVPYSYL